MEDPRKLPLRVSPRKYVTARNTNCTITKLTAKVSAKTANKGALKRYVAFGQTAWEDVERVAAPLFAIEALEKERPTEKPKAKAETGLRLVGAA